MNSPRQISTISRVLHGIVLALAMVVIGFATGAWFGGAVITDTSQGFAAGAEIAVSGAVAALTFLIIAVLVAVRAVPTIITWLTYGALLIALTILLVLGFRIQEMEEASLDPEIDYVGTTSYTTSVK